MNYTACSDYSYPYSHSDADFSHVACSSECYQQSQENDAAPSLSNFMLAASGNLNILLRKPRKSRRKVNLKKYLDRQLKRRLSKLKTIGKSAAELSSSSLRTSVSEESKNIGWDWLLDDDDIEDEENEDEQLRNARGPSRGSAKSKSIKKTRNGGSKTNIQSSWKASTRPQAPLQHNHETKSKATSLHQFQHQQVINDALGENILDLLDTIGDNVSENSDSSYTLSDGSLYSRLPHSTSPVLEHTSTPGYTSTVLPPISTLTTPSMYSQQEIIHHQHQHHHMSVPTPSDHFMQQQHVWTEYTATPSPPLPVFPAPADLPLQLASIPTEQLLPQTAVYY